MTVRMNQPALFETPKTPHDEGIELIRTVRDWMLEHEGLFPDPGEVLTVAVKLDNMAQRLVWGKTKVTA